MSYAPISISGAGIYSDGTIAKSVTKALTIELERSRSSKLGLQIAETLGRDEYERWAFEEAVESSVDCSYCCLEIILDSWRTQSFRLL